MFCPKHGELRCSNTTWSKDAIVVIRNGARSPTDIKTRAVPRYFYLGAVGITRYWPHLGVSTFFKFNGQYYFSRSSQFYFWRTIWCIQLTAIKVMEELKRQNTEKQNLT